MQFTTSEDETLHNEFVNLIGNLGSDGTFYFPRNI